MSDKIKCEICGEEVHSIANHLKTAHNEDSAKPMDLETYRATYPGAEILSELGKKKMAEMKAKREAEEAKVASANPAEGAKPAASANPDVEKVFFHEVFRFPKSTKSAFTKAGTGIPCTADARRGGADDHMVPAWSDNYILNPDLTKTVMMAFEIRTPIFLYGHSGVGKSSIFKQMCAGLNRRLFRFQHTVDTEESHIVGQWVVKPHINPDGSAVSVTEFELGPLPTAMLNGWTYLADEIDRSSPTVLSAYQAILEGEPLIIKNAPAHLRVIKPHPLFAFAATGNTNGTGDQSGLYQATLTQDAATIERFGVVAMVDYPPEKQEIAMIAAATGLSEADAKRIRQFADEIRNKSFPNIVSLTIGPRVAINIARIGMMKADFVEGAMYAYCNRLPEAEKEAALGVAKRILA